MTLTQSELKELNNECCNVNCDLPASHRIYWPGRPPQLLCTIHMQKAVRIAMALGMFLQVEEECKPPNK